MINSITSVTTKPRLSPKCRLRLDRLAGRSLLLYPERGLELNDSAAEIARLCTGEWTVHDIAEHLARTYVDASPDDIRRDLQDFLNTLAGLGLLQGFK